jgi:FtsP/CotA-like multicopper oxidase with cupredoxin domain
VTALRPISRRRALQLGGLGLTATIIGGAGLAWEATSRFDPVAGATLTEPTVLRSAGGALDVRLVAAQGRVRLAGREATMLGYNGGVPGPTLYLQPGDRLRLQLTNQLDEPTNLHVHGLFVSPQDNGDNVFVTIQPGESRHYVYSLPEDHPPGVFWYHPHHHGLVADQVFGGLYGAIVVGDPTPIAHTRERVLVISDISLDAAGRIQPPSTMARMMGREGDLVLVDGQARPRLSARPGERQRWRIVNACAARYLRLRLDGQQLQLLGLDSGRFSQPREVQEVVLAAGNRADLLVTLSAGTSLLRALPYDRGRAMGGIGPAASGPQKRVLASLDVAGAAVPAPAPVQPQPAPRDLRGTAVAARRELTFAAGMGMGAGGMRFTIDGKEFDPDRVDQTVELGTVEEWIITNASPMDHPLHLHVWPMQIVEQRGQPVDAPTWQDVVNIPARSSSKVRVAFDTFAGRTVYHCHILDHEDNGMMGVIDAR